MTQQLEGVIKDMQKAIQDHEIRITKMELYWKILIAEVTTALLLLIGLVGHIAYL